MVASTGILKIIDTRISPLDKNYLVYSDDDSAVDSPPSTVACSGTQVGLLYVFFRDGRVRFYTFADGKVEVTGGAVPGQVCAGAVHVGVDGSPRALAAGGEKRDVEVFERDASSEGGWKSVWKGKNVKRDKLGLEVPVHVRHVSFLPSPEGSYRMATGTHYSHVRLYDTAVSRRPVFTAKISDSPILSLNLHPSTPASPLAPLVSPPPSSAPRAPPETALTAQVLHWVYSDSNGHFGVYSSARRRDVGVYKGSTGAVNAASVFGKDGVVGVGFDRYLKCYEGARRELVVNAYARTRGTAVAVLDEADEAAKVDETEGQERQQQKQDGYGDDDDDDDEEDVWDGMDTLVGGDGDGDGGDGDDFTEALVKVRKRRPRTDKQAGGKKRRVE